MSVFVSYSKKNIEHVGLFSSENNQRGNLDLWIAYQKEENKRNIPPGEDFNNEIISAIRKSTSAVLFVSNDFLDADFVTTRELPEIFKKKEQDKSYKIIPILVEPIRSFENFPELEKLQFVNSPNTHLKTVSGNQKRLILREALDELSFNKSAKRKNFSKLQLSLSTILLLSSILILGLIYNLSETTRTDSNPVIIETEEINSKSFEDLEVGDCYVEQSIVDVWLSNPLLNFPDTDLDISDFKYSYGANTAPNISLSITDCSLPHDYEVVYSFQEPLSYFEDFDIFYPEIIQTCWDQGKLYVGRKFSVLLDEKSIFSNPQWKDLANGNVIVHCLLADYTETKFDDDNSFLKHTRKSASYKNYSGLSEYAIVEAPLDTLEIGDCFNEPGDWAYNAISLKLKTQEPSREDMFGRYLFQGDKAEVVNCLNPHDYEIISKHKFLIDNDKFQIDYWHLGIGVEDNYSVEIIPEEHLLYSNQGIYVEELNKEGIYKQNGGKLTDLIFTINGAPTLTIEDMRFYKASFKNENKLFLEVNTYQEIDDDRFITLVVLDEKPKFMLTDVNLLDYSIKACEDDAQLLMGTDLYQAKTEDQNFVSDVFLKDNTKIDSSYEVICYIKKIQNFTTQNNSMEYFPEDIEKEDLETSEIKFTGSFADSLDKRYKDETVFEAAKNYAKSDLKKWEDIQVGDCLRLRFENYKQTNLGLINSEDYVIVSTDCSLHGRQVTGIKEFDSSNYDIQSSEFETIMSNFCWANLRTEYRSSDVFQRGFVKDGPGHRKPYQIQGNNDLIFDSQANEYKIICTVWLSENIDNGRPKAIGYKHLPWSFEEDKKFDRENQLAIEIMTCPEFIEVKEGHDGYWYDLAIKYSNAGTRIIKFSYIAGDSKGEMEIDLLAQSETPEFYEWYLSKLRENNPLFEFKENFYMFDRVNGAAFDSFYWEGNPGEEGYINVYAEDAFGNVSEASCNFPFVEINS